MRDADWKFETPCNGDLYVKLGDNCVEIEAESGMLETGGYSWVGFELPFEKARELALLLLRAVDKPDGEPDASASG